MDIAEVVSRKDSLEFDLAVLIDKEIKKFKADTGWAPCNIGVNLAHMQEAKNYVLSVTIDVKL